MHGLTHDHSLLTSNLLAFAARYHGDTEIVLRRVEGGLHRHRQPCGQETCPAA